MKLNDIINNINSKFQQIFYVILQDKCIKNPSNVHVLHNPIKSTKSREISLTDPFDEYINNVIQEQLC